MKIKGIILGLALATASIFGSQANAQEVFKKGTNVASALVGFFSSTGVVTGYSTVVPPIQLNFEQGVVDGLIEGRASVGVGGTVDYGMSQFTALGVSSSVHVAFLGARGSFHYQFMPKLDTYTGFSLGINLASTSVVGVATSQNATRAAFGYRGHLGARYYFSPAFAVNAELGYGLALLNIGISYRF